MTTEYSSDSAFRMALEARLVARAREAKRISSALDRKMLVFERLLARLLVAAPDQWVLKGGVALEFRLPGAARTTRDLDLAWLSDSGAVTDVMMTAAQLDLGDRFRFTAFGPAMEPEDTQPMVAGFRFDVSMATRRFETIKVDVGFGDPLPRQAARIAGTTILEFAGIAPVLIPVLPIEQHLAEKYHAYTLPRHGGRVNTRLKDLLDLALIAATTPVDGDALHETLDAIFNARASHPLPQAVPAAPPEWEKRWPGEAAALGLDPSLDRALRLVAGFLDPVLAGEAAGSIWTPTSGAWVRTGEPV